MSGLGDLGEEVLSVTAAGDGTLLVAGEVDLFSAPQLEAEVAAALDGVGDLVIDLGAVTFMDSAGLGLLARSSQPLEAAGRRLVIRNPQPQVRRALEIGGIATLVHVEG